MSFFKTVVSFLKDVATLLQFCLLTLQNEKMHSSQPSEFNLFKLNYG